MAGERSSLVPRDVLETYLEGACHLLARALHQRLGGECHVGVIVDTRIGWTPGDALEDWNIDHVFLILPDGRALDVMGIRSPKEILESRDWPHAGPNPGYCPGGSQQTTWAIMPSADILEDLATHQWWRNDLPGDLDEIADTLAEIAEEACPQIKRDHIPFLSP